MTDENLSKQVCKIFSQPLPYKFSFGATDKYQYVWIITQNGSISNFFLSLRAHPGASDGDDAEAPGAHAPPAVGVKETPSQAKAFAGEMVDD